MPTIIRKLVTQPSTQQLNAAIIGLGHQAVEEHLPAVLASDNYRLVALCDVDEQKLIPLRQKYGSSIGYYNDVEKMLQSCQLDLVIVAVPHHQYGPIIRACASHKVHILKEKPFARNMEEALRFHEDAKKGDIHLMTTFQRRFHPLYQAFVSMLSLIGNIHTITSLYAISSSSPNNGWRSNSEMAGGGVMLDMGYHVLDLLIWYMEKPTILSSIMQITKRSGYDVEDVAQFTFEVNGAYGSALISCVHPKKHEELVFIGEKGSAVLTRDRIERYNNGQQLVDYLESARGWTAAMINQLDYFAAVISGDIEPKYSTPEFQIQNHVVVMDELYNQARGKHYD